MKSKLLLRIAAGIQFFHAVGHTIGVVSWTTKGDVPAPLVQAMQDTQFEFMGKVGSTMAGFYDGFGYCSTLFLVLIAALLWLVSGQKDKTTTKVLWAVGLALTALGVLEIIYFFPMATAFSLISAALVFTSIFLINKAKR